MALDDGGFVPSQLETLQRLRRQYPTPMSREQNGELLNAFCLEERVYAMYAKPDDNSAIMPDGTRISRDVVIDLRTLKAYDTLADSEGAATPTWNELPASQHVTDPERIVVPVGSLPLPVPPSGPTIPPVQADPAVLELLGRIVYRCDAIDATLDALRSDLAQISADVNAPRKLSGRTGGILGASFNGTVTIDE